MFYRQKILLALIEAFGGQLNNTDLEKLLFLFCIESGENYYDFFPYKYGAFSFMTYYDQDKLIEKEILQKGNNFALTLGNSHLAQLKTKDQQALLDFSQRMPQLKGKQLIRKTYLEHPTYAIKSQIAANVLNSQELKAINERGQIDTTPTIFTIGYEGKTIDKYLYELITHNVRALVDVRQNPFSRKHGFSQKQLQKYMSRVGIRYYHLPQLGIPSKLRQNLQTNTAYTELFQHYANEILPHQLEAVATIKELAVTHSRIALTCFEAEACMCHRHKITDFLENEPSFAIPIEHI